MWNIFSALRDEEESVNFTCTAYESAICSISHQGEAADTNVFKPEDPNEDDVSSFG